MICRRRTRRGFTLVEMMVAAAMMIMGMWLLSWVYQQGLESFRQARAQADLTGQQRMVTSILTRDLRANHFLDDDSNPSNHGRRLSDQRLDQMYVSGTTIYGYTPPKGGFFRAYSVDAPAEGYDLDGFASSRSGNHYLHFTSLLPGGPSHQLFSAEVPAGSGSQYFSTAAEIVYFTVANGQTPTGVQLYDLYREQRIVARNTDDAVAYTQPAQQSDAPEVMVAYSGQMRTLAELAMPPGYSDPQTKQPIPSYRLSGPAFTPLSTPKRVTTDKLMSNVLSFEVKFTGQSGDSTYDRTKPPYGWPRPFTHSAANGGGVYNSDFPYDTLPYDGKFDTFAQFPGWNAASNYANTTNSTSISAPPLKPIRITGVMIRLRTYEPRTRTSRQTTLTLDL